MVNRFSFTEFLKDSIKFAKYQAAKYEIVVRKLPIANDDSTAVIKLNEVLRKFTPKFRRLEEYQDLWYHPFLVFGDWLFRMIYGGWVVFWPLYKIFGINLCAHRICIHPKVIREEVMTGQYNLLETFIVYASHIFCMTARFWVRASIVWALSQLRIKWINDFFGTNPDDSMLTVGIKIIENILSVFKFW